MNNNVTLLVGTRKGAFILNTSDRKNWKQSEPIFLGHIIYHFVSDPRDRNVCLMAAKTGHLGPTVFRSNDGGKTWKEATKPPAFTPGEGDERAVDKVFWLTPGHASESGTWYAGTAPAGLFKSADSGDTWQPIDEFNNHSEYKEWVGVGGTPDGQFLHSIIVDPDDRNHLYLGISVGGIFESADGGGSWRPLNRGVAADFLPDANVAFGHDPHCIVMHPTKTTRLYHQNHCGIYRLDRPAEEWVRVGNNMPKEIGDVGFPIVTHPKDADTAWVFPMDGTDVWPRTSPGGKPAVYVTRNAGEQWQRQDKGLPPENAFFTVMRQAMTNDNEQPLGIYFGTTAGEIWASADEGASWTCMARHLPEIFSLAVQG